MLTFLVILLVGFALNSASAFTSAFSRRWGSHRGQLVTFVLRNILGIPVWVIGLGLAVRTPSPPLFRSTTLTEAIGWLLVTVGSVIILLALASLRSKAAMPSVRDSLVQNGAYAHVRHPIYAAMFLEFAAMVLLRPTRAAALSCALGVGWVVIQARLEELDLLQRIPAYREYMKRVPRFFPRRRKPLRA